MKGIEGTMKAFGIDHLNEFFPDMMYINPLIYNLNNITISELYVHDVLFPKIIS